MTFISADLEKSFYLSDSIDDVNLIQEVKKNPILWDSRLKGYRDEKAKAALFREIADKLGKDDVEDVEYRWRVLRRTFIRRKKHAIEKSADGIAVIDWPLFKYLSFLAPIVKHRKFPNKRPVILRCEPGEIQHNPSSNAGAVLPRILTDLSEDDELKCWSAMETAEEALRQEFPGSNQNSMSSSSVEIRKRPVHAVSDITIHDVRGNTDMDTDKVDSRDIDKIRSDTDNLDTDVDKLDRDNLDFFKSLLPMCRNFTNMQKLDFRLDVMNAVRKIVSSQNCYR